MPVYLFTYHSYGSWLPDRAEGYVKRREGRQRCDPEVAKQYRRGMTQETILFSPGQQRNAIVAILDAASPLDAKIHAVATADTHLHILISWKSDRHWELISTSLKRAITYRLQSEFYEQKWLAKGRSRKQIQDRQHFEQLLLQYLPSHPGVRWDEHSGFF